jgi:putative transposase
VEIFEQKSIIMLMPSKYSVRDYAPDSYYHIFNRGVNKSLIFNDTQDYAVFLSFLKRHLDKMPEKDSKGREYLNFSEDIELLAFCLMPNHFHLLIYQVQPDSYTKLLRSICTAYTYYFNKKHKRVGHLFQDRFKASLISNDSYLQHISRYIHLNPENYKTHEWSSLLYYLGKKDSSWLNPQKIMGLFDFDTSQYEIFIDDYRNYEQSLDELSFILADQ